MKITRELLKAKSACCAGPLELASSYHAPTGTRWASAFAGRGATPEDALAAAPRRLRLLADEQREKVARHAQSLKQILATLTHFPEEESP